MERFWHTDFGGRFAPHGCDRLTQISDKRRFRVFSIHIVVKGKSVKIRRIREWRIAPLEICVSPFLSESITTGTMPSMPHYSPRLAPPALDTGLLTGSRLRRSDIAWGNRHASFRQVRRTRKAPKARYNCSTVSSGEAAKVRCLFVAGDWASKRSGNLNRFAMIWFCIPVA